MNMFNTNSTTVMQSKLHFLDWVLTLGRQI